MVLGLTVLALLGSQALAAPVLGSTPGRVSAERPATAAAIVAAVPQGHLAPQGCTVSGSTATCELWAKTGSTTILGQPMPIWGYATGAAATPTAPGPVLVVTEGQTVNVVLHNQLTQNTALAFPGQPATAFTGTAPGGTVAGVGNGGTASYTFAATRPGTYLYEAGHTPDGARQVALGMAGALVVLPASGIGAYGSAQTAYDDEAVLVLSELDPALNTSANPAQFDLRQFQARYRLINGRVFPSTDPVATGVNRTVLLRYVNAGAVPHSMDLLGGSQQRIALGGYPTAHPTTSLVADLPPGSTMDTLVRTPSAGGAKLTLFEAGGHLNNNGMTESDPTRIATGGMMTFIDTAAPAPSTDVVGPVPSRLTVAPSPADGTVPAVVTADVSDLLTGQSTVDAAELVVDDATSQQPGFGLPMSAVGGYGTTTVHVTAAIPVGTANDAGYCTANPITLSCLSAGKHRIFVRGHDAAGNWGVVSDVLFNLPKVGPLTRAGTVSPDPTNGASGVDIDATGDDSGAGGNINQAEWSLDTLAASGSGTTMTVGGGGTVAALTAHIPAAAFASLAEGTHHVFVRSHDSLGLWGPELDIPFTVDATGPTVNAAAVAPNPTNGKLDDPGNPGNLVVSASITDAAGGLVVRAEGFLDPGPTPTPGTGFALVATDGSLDSAAESAYGLIPLSAVTSLANGNHRVVVRAKDNAGNWGELFTAPLVVDRIAPTLGALTAAPNPTNGAATVAISGNTSESGLNAAEVWLGADPGKGNATPATISVNQAGTRVTVTVAVPPFAVGTRVVNVRIQDKAGNWSNTRSVVVTVRGGNPPAGSAAALLGFASQSGNVTASPVAGIPHIGNANLGMLATAVANTPAYVMTTGGPAHGFQATLALNRNTLRTATNGIITLFDGRTATTSGVFAVQMRTTSTTAAQLRAVLTRSNGTVIEGPWVNFTTGAHLLTLTWSSGPATGTARGQLRVTLDNAVVINQFADTATRTLGSLRLGIVDATTPAARSAWTGSMYVDDYSAMGVL
jgi:hypothetical protein